MSPITTLIGGAAGLLLGSKRPSTPSPTLQTRRNAEAEAAANRDLLSRRRGAGANQLTGRLGAESSAGKSQLGA